MGIYINGMEMPKSCYDCVLSHSFFRDMNCANLEGMSGFVGALPHTDDRHPNCPLIPVSPHGRLIDADDVDNHIIGHVDLRDCPTIIPAEEG